MSYSSPTYLTTPVGNNQFAYAERLAMWNAQLFIPALQKISDVTEVKLGNDIVFAEVDTQGKVKTCTGLAAFYHLEQQGLPPTRIMDNHNHALVARVTTYNKHNLPLTVVHIDQHADLWTTPIPFDPAQKNNEDYLWHYTNEICTIASFIQPLIDAHIVQECLQIRSWTKLTEISKSPPTAPYILDIDLDFFALTLQDDELNTQLDQLRSLLANAQMCTIATSPYFLEQHRVQALLTAIIRK